MKLLALVVCMGIVAYALGASETTAAAGTSPSRKVITSSPKAKTSRTPTPSSSKGNVSSKTPSKPSTGQHSSLSPQSSNKPTRTTPKKPSKPSSPKPNGASSVMTSVWTMLLSVAVYCYCRL